MSEYAVTTTVDKLADLEFPYLNADRRDAVVTTFHVKFRPYDARLPDHEQDGDWHHYGAAVFGSAPLRLSYDADPLMTLWLLDEMREAFAKSGMPLQATDTVHVSQYVMGRGADGNPG